MSQVERDLLTPSVSALKRIGDALEIPAGSLMFGFETRRPGARIGVVRQSGRKKVAFPDSRITYELLTPDLRRRTSLLWLTAPPGQTLCPDPLVRVFANFVPDSVCAWLIEQARPHLKRALIYDPVGGKDIADHMRTNSAAGFDLMHADVVQAAVQWRMSTAVGVPIEHMEGPTVLHYAIGEQITNHYDFVNPRIQNYQAELEKRGQRIVTFLVYLNDDYEGGETDFPEIGLRYHGAKGNGIFFTNALPNGAPDLRMVHAGLPPRDNEKWLMSQFIRNRAVLGARAENQA